MRPYIAIIVDSFREALYSRVLWVLLGLITLFLLAVMPLGLTHPMTTTIQRGAIVSSQQFAQRLESNGQVEDTVGQAVWDALPESLKERMKPIAAGESDGRQRFEVMSELTSKLNDFLQKQDAFSDEQIGKVKLTEEGEELLEVDRDDRSEMQQRRLNRLALGSAFRRDLRSGPDRSVLVSYFGRPVGDPLPFGEKQTKQFIKFLVAGLMNFIGATIGVFTAILVTASIIPNMFDAGSVNLLFSKPIMRPLLYLSKYIGGCWFVLINAAYLICGIYFVVGWRFDIWNSRVFWAIPILMFLFAVYYSVSAFAGIVWRNTIMCVVAAILFWAACFSVGFVYELIDGLMMQPRRIIKAVKTGDGVLTISENGSISNWQEDTQGWSPVLAASSGGAGPPAFARQNNLLGPVYDKKNNRVIAIERRSSRSRLIAGQANTGWEREELDSAPSNCKKLMQSPDGEFYVLEPSGISKIVEVEDRQNKDLKIFGMKYTIGRKRGSFRPAAPRGYEFATDAETATINATDGSICVYGNGEVQRLEKPEQSNGRFKLAKSAPILEQEQEVLMAASGNSLIIADDEGVIHLLDAQSLEPKQKFTPFGQTKPRFVESSPGGNFIAVLSHDRRVWLFDVANQKDISRIVSGQSNLTAAEFSGSDSLLIADRIDRVREISLPSGDTIAEMAPKPSIMDQLFRYAIKPLYAVFPKPGKLKETSVYLLTEQDSMVAGEDNRLEGARVQLQPWTPVYHSAIFTMVMLGAACAYIYRQEF